VSRARATSTSTQRTRAPSRAKRIAAALPLPSPGPREPAPVTIATLPASLPLTAWPSGAAPRSAPEAPVGPRVGEIRHPGGQAALEGGPALGRREMPCRGASSGDGMRGDARAGDDTAPSLTALPAAR